ncbi:hypothetical protein DYB34_004862 [Aphanomyces astaci]|uniref:Glutamate-rich WD repeat-containing protein 1 n=1 Tax=Aphanomyces astaci TaxID=112090 RepID=A0A3R6X3C6_APHAT|nr:hypothetical protein DYB34_004862 [Aphanomyces astaci]
MTIYVVAGSQAPKAADNKITVMKMSELHKTKHNNDADDNSDDDSDDDDEEGDPVLESRSIDHRGGVNRIRAMPQSSNIVATWSDTKRVHIYDIAKQLQSLDGKNPAGLNAQAPPVFTFTGHADEGFAMDWSPVTAGSLLTGDCSKYIYHWVNNGASWVVDKVPFTGHTASVEDLQWSPTEATVFASCSADKTVRIWDVRTKARSMLSVEAHEQDVNVITWNRNVAHLMASGSDDGSFKIWDFRKFQAYDNFILPSLHRSDSPVAHFRYHTAPVTSIEWHPTDESMLAVSGADNQISIWDMSVEEDAEAAANVTTAKLDVPPQLLFIHQGQTDIKELHFHPQCPGLLVSTAADGFNVLERYVEISNVVADGKFQDVLAQAKASPKPQRLAYYFGSHDLYGRLTSTQVKPWLHSQHLAYTKGFPSRACSDDQTALLLSHAVREATDFVVTDPAERVLPELTSADYNFAGNHVAVVPFKKAPRVVTIVVDSDDDVPTTSAPSSPSPPALTNNGNVDRRRRKTIVPRVSTPEPRKRWLGESVALKQVPVNSVCWAKTEVFVDPWLPVFVCNPSELDPAVQNLGQIEPWNGANHDAYLYQTWLDDEDLDGVALGVEDAEAFVASNSARPYESESENARISADKGDVWDDMGDDETYSNESGSDVDIAEPPLFPHNAVKVVEVATSSTPPTDELRSPIEPKLDLDIAKTNQDVFKLVYFFGRHDLYEFLATSAVTRVLPYMVPSDLDPDVTEPEVPLLPKESIVWALTKDHPWMPGYLCDPWSSPKKLASCRLPIVTND